MPGDGRVNTATRSDLALAGAVVLTQEKVTKTNRITLLPTETWSFGELARIISEAAGKNVVYQPVSYEEQKGMLVQAGLPDPVADMIAGIYKGVSEGETSRTSDDLKILIGPLTPLKETVKQALQS